MSADDSQPLRPIDVPRAMPSRNAAAQRRAMQAAMANAVRAMRSPRGRRLRVPGSDHVPPAGGS